MDAKMKLKRIDILKKIDVLSTKCNCVSAHDSKGCSNCEKIVKHGKSLLKLVDKRISVFGKDLEPHERKERTPFIFTNEEYQAYKAEAKTDKEIAKLRNVDLSTLYKWKKRNNIKITR